MVSGKLNAEQVERFLAFFPSLVRHIENRRSLPDLELDILLAGHDLQNEVWAKDKAKRVAAILIKLFSSTFDKGTAEAVKNALHAQGIPFASVILAIPQLNINEVRSEKTLKAEPEQLSFGKVGIHEKKQLKLALYNGPCRLRCDLKILIICVKKENLKIISINGYYDSTNDFSKTASDIRTASIGDYLSDVGRLKNIKIASFHTNEADHRSRIKIIVRRSQAQNAPTNIKALQQFKAE